MLAARPRDDLPSHLVTTTPRARLAVVGTLLLAMAAEGCATTAIMVTDYDQRRPEQYRLLWVDLAVVGVTSAVGGGLYGASEPSSVGERVGLGMLLGAAVWAGWTLIFSAMLRMPDRPARRDPARAP